jgi:hypothetical protein
VVTTNFVDTQEDVGKSFTPVVLELDSGATSELVVYQLL